MDELDDPGSLDIVDGVGLGTPGSVPSYLITAMMHSSDVFDDLQLCLLCPAFVSL